MRTLGKGGFGQALLLFHNATQKYFVAKHINLAPLTAQQRKDAHNEIAILQQLENPNIVKYVEYVEEYPHLYIVMEYADGGDLYTLLKRIKSTGKSLTEDQIVDLFVQVLMAVKYMHDKRVLHPRHQIAKRFPNPQPCCQARRLWDQHRSA